MPEKTFSDEDATLREELEALRLRAGLKKPLTTKSVVTHPPDSGEVEAMPFDPDCRSGRLGVAAARAKRTS